VALIDLERLSTELRALGVTPGRDLLVHCSMRRIGWVDGGPATLLAALRQVIGGATLVVPTQTATTNTTTSERFRAAAKALSAEQLAELEARIPGFDWATSPAEGMGTLAEHVRRHPDSVRSRHPQTSFAAIGPRSSEFMAVHDLDCHLGERSPVGRLYAAGADILLIGVGYEACTALHLAEYRQPSPVMRPYRCYVVEDGRRVLKEFIAVDLDATQFRRLGDDLEPLARHGAIGRAPSRLLPLREAVDFAVDWFGHLRLWKREGESPT